MTEKVKKAPLDFAARVKISLLLQGKTQAQLANEIGITRQYLNAIIHGKAESPDIKRRICFVLGVDYED